MSRSRSSAKAAGSRMERMVADCLSHHVDDRVDRRVKTGAADKGDIGGLRTHTGKRVVVEVKDYGGRYLIGPWLDEAETERINDDATAGVVIAKRRGITDPLQQVCVMQVADLIALITGSRP
ncbi:hypothetical protein NCCP2495_05650 [Dietzia sp. NCCP-2495]|uniref:hypothetical protein n=1 Tax=Dietzia sp. NCCP-2495 TaxID=2934675 RepID=UPI00223197E5|nr:hypothetical protein [Dietzia sp. NCCP-2495]GLB62687.1 hypothetical protein NCCP2495_05650 [Dietzia sp. NCCP-2495]